MKYQVFRAIIEIPLNHLKDVENIHSIFMEAMYNYVSFRAQSTVDSPQIDSSETFCRTRDTFCSLSSTIYSLARYACIEFLTSKC